MTTNRKFTKTFKEAKELFKLKTGIDFSSATTRNGIDIFKLKTTKTPTRRFFVGTKIEWLNI